MPPCILGQILQFLESVYYVLLDNVYFRVQCESERSTIDIWKWLCIEMYILWVLIWIFVAVSKTCFIELRLCGIGL